MDKTFITIDAEVGILSDEMTLRVTCRKCVRDVWLGFAPKSLSILTCIAQDHLTKYHPEVIK